jgi:hypothetical protein
MARRQGYDPPRKAPLRAKFIAKEPSVAGELTIEICLALLLFCYPYGAEQMNLPHNFWVGLASWAFGIGLAVRIFWIVPLWRDRLNRFQKGAAACALIGIFAWAVHAPVIAAYQARHSEAVGRRPIYGMDFGHVKGLKIQGGTIINPKDGGINVNDSPGASVDHNNVVYGDNITVQTQPAPTPDSKPRKH